jgi:hypothetical protein
LRVPEQGVLFDMRESLELRVNESHAHRVFRADEGVALSDRVRKVVISTTDHRLSLLRDTQAELRGTGSPLFRSNSVARG